MSGIGMRSLQSSRCVVVYDKLTIYRGDLLGRLSPLHIRFQQLLFQEEEGNKSLM